MSWQQYDSTAPADTFGDYAVDHGHADDMYAPSAGMLESEAIRLECLEAERRTPRRDDTLVTRPAYVLTEAEKRRNRQIADGTWKPPAQPASVFPYGWCGYCPNFTYSDLWHGACGDCRWRWGHYPDTMPAALRRYRAEMTYGHDWESCAGTNCARYGEAAREWTLCTTHSVKFPAGGEQNTAGACAFTEHGEAGTS
jgi:hypothetical protein